MQPNLEMSLEQLTTDHIENFIKLFRDFGFLTSAVTVPPIGDVIKSLEQKQEINLFESKRTSLKLSYEDCRLSVAAIVNGKEHEGYNAVIRNSYC